jgi:hypothetical protein
MLTMPPVRRPTVSDLAGVCLSTMTVLGGERLVHHDAGVGQREAHARLPNRGCTPSNRYWIRDGVVTEHPIEVWDG